MQPRLFEYIGGILRAEGCVLVAAGEMPDHLHLLVSLAKRLSILEALRIIKAGSSRWLHDRFPDVLSGFAWQAGYGAFSVSHSGLKDVRGYIRNQAEHHARRTFQEEFRILLDKHELEYDERYVWD